jgi:hypothetical protein
MLESAKLAELTADEVAMYFRKRLMQRRRVPGASQRAVPAALRDVIAGSRLRP